MVKLWLMFLAVAICFSSAFAQSEATSNCPSIHVTGPAGFVKPGDLAEYTVTIGPEADRYAIEILWSVSEGEIKDEIKEGHGTRSIKVIQPNTPLVATVEIKGLPTGCPSTASQWAGGHPHPAAEKIYELHPGQPISEDNIQPIAQAALARPTNQLYILAGDVGRKNSAAFQRKSTWILKLLSENGVAADRVTMASVYSDVELFQFWLVPAGASNPTCDGCGHQEKAKACPTIIVTGPAGVVQPGETMIFKAAVTGEIPTRVTYHWILNDSDIIGGQGSLELRAKYRASAWGGNVIATLQVSGLPKECSNTASDVLPVTVHPEPELIGRISNSRYVIDKSLLRRIGRSLRASSSSQLYVWVYHDPTEITLHEIRARLFKQLSVTKIDRTRFTIVGDSSRNHEASFWRVPVGAENPSP